jgi:hypothetical protein
LLTTGKQAENANDGEKHINVATVAAVEALERSRYGRLHSIGGGKHSIDGGKPSGGGAKHGIDGAKHGIDGGKHSVGDAKRSIDGGKRSVDGGKRSVNACLPSTLPAVSVDGCFPSGGYYQGKHRC